MPVESVEKIRWQHQTLGVDYKPVVRYGPSPAAPRIGTGLWARGRVRPVPTEDV